MQRHFRYGISPAIMLGGIGMSPYGNRNQVHSELLPANIIPLYADHADFDDLGYGIRLGRKPACSFGLCQ